MNRDKIHSLKGKLKAKDTKKIAYLNFIRKEISRKSGLNFNQDILFLSEEKRYFFGLKYFTTTNKAICEALFIPVEAGCRYKASLIKENNIAESCIRKPCSFTGYLAKYLTTNKDEFNSDLFVKPFKSDDR